MAEQDGLEAVVLGRVSADLYPAPDQLRLPLRRIQRFERFVGGFAGNVAVGLARLGVPVAIASRVGDDGHGEFIRDFLTAEAVDVTWLGVDPVFRTALAFCEIWPPDSFPITFYRTPTCPDWRLSGDDVDLERIGDIPLLFTTGTGLARSPSREVTLEAMARHRGRTIFDLDHRPVLWEDRSEYPAFARRACESADIVVGNVAELDAASGRESEREAAEVILGLGAELVVAKRGEEGCGLHDGTGVTDVPGIPVTVVNGLGAGDAFAAAFGFGLLRGKPPVRAARLGNAAGAIVASRIPCSTAMPTFAEVKEALRDVGVSRWSEP